MNKRQRKKRDKKRFIVVAVDQEKKIITIGNLHDWKKVKTEVNNDRP